MGYHVLHTRASILSYSPGEPTGNSLPIAAIAERNSRKRAEDSARTSRGMIVTRYTGRPGPRPGRLPSFGKRTSRRTRPVGRGALSLAAGPASRWSLQRRDGEEHRVADVTSLRSLAPHIPYHRRTSDLRAAAWGLGET